MIKVLAVILCGCLLSGCATIAVGALAGYVTAVAVVHGAVTGAASGITSYAVQKELKRREVWREYCRTHTDPNCTGWYGR